MNIKIDKINITENWDKLESFVKNQWKETEKVLPFNPDIESAALLEKQGNLHTLVAHTDKEIVGYFVFIVEEDIFFQIKRAHNVILYCQPKYRGNGIASRLINESYKYLPKDVKVFNCSMKPNDHSTKLMEKEGFSLFEQTFIKVL